MMVQGIKPRGFWFSEGLSMLKFWKDNMQPIDLDNSYIYEVKIKDPNHKLLILKTFDDVLAFNNKFRQTHKYVVKGKIRKMSLINWYRVSEEYDGLYVKNYNQIRKKNFDLIGKKLLWYYTFDWSSGCIWNFNNIDVKLKLIKI